VSVVCCYYVRAVLLRRADHSSRGVLLSVVCLSVTEEPYRGGLGRIGLSSHEKKVSVYDLKVKKKTELRYQTS
jgi:hypothetical protein